MFFPLALLALAAPRSIPGDRLDVDQVRDRVDSMAVFDVPCAYTLKTRTYFLDLSELPKDPELEHAIRALRSATSGPAPTVASVWPAFERRAEEELAARRTCLTRTTHVTSTADLQMQIQIAPVLDGILGRYRKGHVDLYVVAHPLADIDPGVPNQIVAQPPSDSPPIDDLQRVLQPLPIQRAILDGWSELVWEPREAADTDRVFVRPVSNEGGHVLDFDRADGLPRRAAAYFTDPDVDGTQASFVGCYEFDDSDRSGWIRRVVHLAADSDKVAVDLYEVSDVRFEFVPEDHVLVAPPHCVLFDYRSGQETYYGVDRSTWPLDVQLPLGASLPIASIEPTAGGPSSGVWNGAQTAAAVGAILAGIGFVFATGRRRMAT